MSFNTLNITFVLCCLFFVSSLFSVWKQMFYMGTRHYLLIASFHLYVSQDKNKKVVFSSLFFGFQNTLHLTNLELLFLEVIFFDFEKIHYHSKSLQVTISFLFVTYFDLENRLFFLLTDWTPIEGYTMDPISVKKRINFLIDWELEEGSTVDPISMPMDWIPKEGCRRDPISVEKRTFTLLWIRYLKCAE